MKLLLRKKIALGRAREGIVGELKFYIWLSWKHHTKKMTFREWK